MGSRIQGTTTVLDSETSSILNQIKLKEVFDLKNTVPPIRRLLRNCTYTQLDLNFPICMIISSNPISLFNPTGLSCGQVKLLHCFCTFARYSNSYSTCIFKNIRMVKFKMISPSIIISVRSNIPKTRSAALIPNKQLRPSNKTHGQKHSKFSFHGILGRYELNHEA